MFELDSLFLLVRCATVVYLVRFVDRQCGNIFTDNSVFRNLFNRTGVWGFILLLASVTLAAPRLVGDSPGGKSPSSLFSPHQWNILPSFGSSGNDSPTIKLDTIETARYHGYDAERHWVTTEDGYILGVHRIFNRSIGDEKTLKPVVVIHHAFVLSSRDFLTLGPGRSLGYNLADAGYDVWLCNARGNTYSRNHTSISPKKKEFWDFSYTEHATYDIPAVIDYTLNVTGNTKVHYIGHSIGTINFLIMGTKRPEVLSKVKSYTALAPIATTTNTRSGILKTVMKNYRAIAKGFEQAGLYAFLSHPNWLTTVGNTVCSDGWVTQRMCTAFLFALCGDNPNFDKSILPEMLAHTPSGSSLKTFRHFGQNFVNGFREYDYGAEENLARYNSTEPPVFDYSKINVPSQLFYGLNDLMAHYKDSIEICQTLPNVYRCEAVDDPKFGHIDFLWASNAPVDLYPKLIEGLRRFDGDTNTITN